MPVPLDARCNSSSASIPFAFDPTALPAASKVSRCADLVLIDGFFDDVELRQLQNAIKGARYTRQLLQDPEHRLPDWAHERFLHLMRPSQPRGVHFNHDTGFVVASDVVSRDGEIYVHKDLNGRPERFASLLAYVERPITGGHTIFPAIETAGLTADEHARHAAFVAAQPTDEHSMRSAAAGEMCAQLVAGASNHFGVEPVPGSAVVWWHWVASGADGELRPSSLPSAWHGGCPHEGRKALLRSFVVVDALSKGRVFGPDLVDLQQELKQEL